MKKYISMLLSFIVLISIFSIPVYADEIKVNANEQPKTGWIAAKATVPQNFVYDVYVTVVDESGKDYTLQLYDTNGYEARLEVPVGKYEILNAGVKDDYIATFAVDFKNEKPFDVAANTSAALIEFTVYSTEEAPTTSPVKETTEKTTITSDTHDKDDDNDSALDKPDETEKEPEKGNLLSDEERSTLITSSIGFVFVMIICIAGIYIYKHKDEIKKKRK